MKERLHTVFPRELDVMQLLWVGDREPPRVWAKRLTLNLSDTQEEREAFPFFDLQAGEHWVTSLNPNQDSPNEQTGPPRSLSGKGT